MSLVDKIRKKISDELTKDVEQELTELKAKFDELLSEVKLLNKNVSDIKQILQKMLERCSK
jgi:hypothetical protein